MMLCKLLPLSSKSIIADVSSNISLAIGLSSALITCAELSSKQLAMMVFCKRWDMTVPPGVVEAKQVLVLSD